MIDHAWLTVSNFKASVAFYEQALAPLGYKKLMEFWEWWEWSAAWFGENMPDFWVMGWTANKPHVHIGFVAKSREVVDQFYDAAIKAGGKDNGKPGIRKDYHPTYYAAFVWDPDGHNIEAVCQKPE